MWKIPLLLCHAVFTYCGMTPPRGPPPARELDRFTAPDLMTRTTHLQIAATAVSKYIICGLAMAEAVVLVARCFPITTSTGILPVLLPDAEASDLRLTPVSLAACICGITGALIRMWCHRTLGRLFTWQMAVVDHHELITGGPYALVRHPSYFGWLLMVGGSFALLFSRESYFVQSGLGDSFFGKVAVYTSLAYCTFSTVNLMGRMAKEDAVLKQEFGGRWDEYARKTRYCLVPLLY
ncbi:ICMT-domain-containing protein [Fomes fomentarius]|nr:ICMT-domain-containing protein [Fomes fomentarius]